MDEQNLGKIIADYFNVNNKTNIFLERQAIDLWESVVGQGIAANTNVTGISRGVIYVKVNSASLKFELTSMRTKIKDDINKKLGVDIVTNIVFK